MKLKLFLGVLGITVSTWAAVQSQVAENSQGSFAAQMSVAKNASLPMGARWSALLRAADVASSEQIEEIRTFTKSSDWYMRNAAMMALSKMGGDYAIEEAKKLVKDKALVVRSAAVDLIATKFTLENRKILADELAQNYNFKGKHSLWIRPQIMKHLASRASRDDRAFFARYLFDQDSVIEELAADTLEKITDVNFSGKDHLAQWKVFVKEKKWL
ncbi:MAG: hypothetical protein H7328_04910 [Bdellovibrio sp.]|nr:hypothetical protein [Bdellovibrio sp.]